MSWDVKSSRATAFGLGKCRRLEFVSPFQGLEIFVAG